MHFKAQIAFLNSFMMQRQTMIRIAFDIQLEIRLKRQQAWGLEGKKTHEQRMSRFIAQQSPLHYKNNWTQVARSTTSY